MQASSSFRPPFFRLPFSRFAFACRRLGGWTIAIMLAAAPIAASADDASGKAEIRVIKDETGRPSAFEALGLTADLLEKLGRLEDAQEAFGRILAVYVADGPRDPDRPPLAGTYSVEGTRLRFTPRFALRSGTTYRALLTPERGSTSNPPADAKEAKASPITLEVKLPEAPRGPPAEVVRIFPSSNTLPENQLRFYVHFSAPMARGEAYEHVRLLDSKGRTIAQPFLELGEELWDPSARRFTLLIDPGRIKRGLKPREELGPVLDAGGEYTLVVERTWHDAFGRALRDEFRKKFRVGPPVATAIDPAEWKIVSPERGSTAALKVKFPRPLDHALMQRTISVEDSQGDRVSGKVTVSDEERTWEFVPERPWTAGKYELAIDGALEDLSGNRIGEPFEVDRVGPIERTARTETFRVPFEIR